MASSGAAKPAAKPECWGFLALLFLLLPAPLDASPLNGKIYPSPDRLYEEFAELVLPYGYPLQQHFVTTPDGYILRMFRIPPARGGPAPAPVVYLQHGLLDSAAGFLLNGPGRSLAFLLADEGYDVFLGNSRGNTYSANHTTISVADAAFWAFSWDEMALVDLPAALRHVAALTGAQRLGYVGHSQGTQVALAALASDSWLREHISVAVLLAPVAFVTHITSLPLLAMARLGTDGLFALAGLHRFLPSQALAALLEGELCGTEPGLCINFLAAICGYNAGNLDASKLPLYLRYTPAGTSVQNMAHWAQQVRQARPNLLQRFDYGLQCVDRASGMPRRCNQLIYGSAQPPAYNLSAVHTPLGLFTGGRDRLAPPLDVEFLLEALPAGSVVAAHEEPLYEHLDMVWGSDAHERLYPRVLQLLRQYNSAAPLRQQLQQYQK